MDTLKLKALAALRWGWDHIVNVTAMIWAKLRALFDTVYDPPPRTIRVWFWSAVAVIAAIWIGTFAFTNSWFNGSLHSLADFSYVGGDDPDVALPELEPLPSVPTPAEVSRDFPAPANGCQDMSDTPHCPDKVVTVEPVVVEELPPPVAKPLDTKKKNSIYRKAKKREPYQTYWGF